MPLLVSWRGLAPLLLGVLLSACGSAAGAPATTPAASPVAGALSLDGAVTLLVNGIGLPNGTGYDVAVAFHVRNTDPNYYALDVPYRVTLSAGGGPLFSSTGHDTLSLAPGAERLVVYTTSQSPVNQQPRQASVELYPAPSLLSLKGLLLPQSQFQLSHTHIQCGSSVECQATADLTWSGSVPVTLSSLQLALHEGTDASGAIVAAGADTPSTTRLAPGQSVPITLGLRGFPQSGASGPAQAPATPLFWEIEVSGTASGA